MQSGNEVHSRGGVAFSPSHALAEVVAPRADGRGAGHQFECLRDWSLVHTLDEVEAWFRRRRADCPMRVDDIPLEKSGKYRYVQSLVVGG